MHATHVMNLNKFQSTQKLEKDTTPIFPSE